MARDPSAVEHETLTWEAFGGACRALASEIVRDGFEPEIVLAVARGGLPLAGALAYALDVKSCFAMNVLFYAGIDEHLEVPVVLPPTLNIVDIRARRVLIADDVADTGKTLELVRKTIADSAAEVRCAVLFTKPWSISEPEYVWRRTDRWIDFPWSAAGPITT
jgi:hypoxanthine phosphoribosyltransferase